MTLDRLKFPRAPGEIFIHELVHAWQIYHTQMDLGWMAHELVTLAFQSYNYGPAGLPFSDFNQEEQAQIVQDWFAGNDPVTHMPKNPPMNESNPYFRYIADNIRLGALTS